MPLTALGIKQAKPAAKPKKLSDGKGLYLLVHPAGGKYWRMKYRHAGKENTLALGVWPDVSLAKARDGRDAARKLLAEGLDPIEVRRSEERQRVLNNALSFEVIAREWHEHQRGRWINSHAEQVLLSLEANVFPALGSRPVTDISPEELLNVVRAVERRGALDVAGRILQRCSSVFRYAIQTSRAKINPATELRGALRSHKVTHRAALSAESLPEFLQKLDHYDGHMLTRLALRLVMLTFVRSNELREARWEEFDIDQAMWRIPAERMKMRSAHLVPLSSQAIGVLEQILPITGRFDLVFPSQSGIKKTMSENTLLYAMYRMGYHGRATVHGFRATASTILNENAFSSDAIERQLAHAERNKVRAAYHRSEHLPERKRMMQWWADYLDTAARSIGQVVPMQAHGGRSG